MPIGKEDDAPGPIDMPRGNAGEVLAVFLRLGLTSFGGPVAHLGFFRDEFVIRRRWLDDRGYADLVALCQFLPGRLRAKSESPSGCCARVTPAPWQPG
jgi:hypothetical protein